ncbi:hypothetical protein BC829DRAFT_9298 [Chytridium lagenaria]|nr:hypothetical protein BC829DRAFT_9298 [Chytridium lagenaria]
MLMAFLLLASKAGASGTAELQWYFRISFFGLLSIVAMETLFSPSAFRVAIEFSIIAILSISGATMSLIFQNKKGSKKVLQSGSSALTMRGSMREYSYFLGKWKIWHKTTFGWHFAHIFQVIFVQRNDRMYITLLPTPSKQNPELKKEDVILHEVEGLWGSNLFTETSKGLSLFNHQPIIESDQTPTSTDDIPIDSGLNRCVLLDLPNWTVLMKAEKKYYKNEAVEILKRHAEGIARIMSMNEIEGSSGLYASGNMR